MNRQYELGILTRKDGIVALDHQKWPWEEGRKRGEKSKHLYENEGWRLTWPPEVLDAGQGRCGSESGGSCQSPCWGHLGLSPSSLSCAVSVYLWWVYATHSFCFRHMAPRTWYHIKLIQLAYWWLWPHYLLVPITNLCSQGHGFVCLFPCEICSY